MTSTCSGSARPCRPRGATIRTDALVEDAGKELAEDPQIKSAFGLVQSLGLGEIPPEVKARSLKVGSAAQRVLAGAR